MKHKKLAIISGATGSLGQAYLQILSKRGIKCIGLSRKKPKKKRKSVTYLHSDLLDKFETKKALGGINIEEYGEVIVIHTVGKFKFEENKKPELDINGDGIDDFVFDSNIKTFENILNFLLKKIDKKSKLTLCAFGSVSDKYEVPFWKSYTKSKNVLREIIKKYSNNQNMRGVFVNVSTVDTKNENLLRPSASKKYWLTSEKIVQRTKKEIFNGKRKFIELDIFKPNPDFKKDYYLNHEEIFKKWKKEMKKSN